MSVQATSPVANDQVAGEPPVCILLVNWNGWANTIECLESIFRLAYANYRVIVCDNGSTDGSLLHIRDWAEGRLSPVSAVSGGLRRLTRPPVAKPIPYLECKAGQEPGPHDVVEDCPLLLIASEVNRGFAGGINPGLRYALGNPATRFVWLLNNDTVVMADSLRLMVAKMLDDPSAGVCGATLLEYDDPGRIWCLGGGSLNRWLGVTRRIGAAAAAAGPIDAARIARSMAYVSGACMLVSRDCLTALGPMDEAYFLYYEELDWQLRGRSRCRPVYCRQALVYHKGAGSVTSASSPAITRAIADYHYIRSRLLFTKRHFPWALPTVIAGLLATLIKVLLRSGPGRIRNVLRVFPGLVRRSA